MAHDRDPVGDPTSQAVRRPRVVEWESDDIQQYPPAWAAPTEAAPTSGEDISNDAGAFSIDQKQAAPLPFCTRLRYALPSFSTTSLTILISLYVNDFYGMLSFSLSHLCSEHDRLQLHGSSYCCASESHSHCSHLCSQSWNKPCVLIVLHRPCQIV